MINADLVYRVFMAVVVSTAFGLSTVGSVGLLFSYINTFCWRRRILVKITNSAFVPLDVLLPGEYGWTVPTNLFADQDGRLWLLVSTNVTNQSVGDNNMKVIRVNRGFLCDLSECPNMLWSKTERSSFGAAVPVIGVVDDINWRRHATLSPLYLTLPLSEVKVGKTYWCNPAALFADQYGQLKLDGRALCRRESSGGYQMRVTRFKDGFECVHCDRSTWKPPELPVEESAVLHVRSAA